MGGSDDRQTPPEPFAGLHRDAARIDGWAKVLVGALLVGVSGLALLGGLFGVWALFRLGVVQTWTIPFFIIGLGGVGFGSLWALWGLVKILTGRGRG